MKKLAVSYLFTLAILTLAAVLLFRYCWPEHYPGMLFTIPLYYGVLLGIMFLIRHIVVDKYGKDEGVFLLSYRMVRLLLSIILLVICFSLAKSQPLPYAVTFFVYYLILSWTENIILIKGEKKS